MNHFNKPLSDAAIAAHRAAAEMYAAAGMARPGLYVRHPSGAVYASVSGPVAPSSRAELRDLLRTSGLSKSKAEKAATGAWHALSPEAALADASQRISAAILKFKAAL